MVSRCPNSPRRGVRRRAFPHNADPQASRHRCCAAGVVAPRVVVVGPCSIEQSVCGRCGARRYQCAQRSLEIGCLKARTGRNLSAAPHNDEERGARNLFRRGSARRGRSRYTTRLWSSTEKRLSAFAGRMTYPPGNPSFSIGPHSFRPFSRGERSSVLEVFDLCAGAPLIRIVVVGLVLEDKVDLAFRVRIPHGLGCHALEVQLDMLTGLPDHF